MYRNMIQRQPDSDKRFGPPANNKDKRMNPNDMHVAGPERTHDLIDDINHAPENEPSGEIRRTVTNHDEQNRVTNADDSALNERETEGD